MKSAPTSNLIGGLLLGVVIGLIFQVGGYLLIRGDNSFLGVAMFIAVPITSGFAVAAVVRRPSRIIACTILCGLMTLTMLLMCGWEGIICCAMALPLLVAGVALGAFIGYYFRGRVIDQMSSPGKATTLMLLICPLFVAAVDHAERPRQSTEQQETFSTEMTVGTSQDHLWALLAEMKPMGGPRPFLLRIGLPVPTRCELEAPTLGSVRVCYFDQGRICQKVSTWQPPRQMGVQITENTLPGRHWLTFIDASYELEALGSSTRIVRHTTIGTRLYPRWYWRPFERWGVTSEHDFVFSNLRRWAESK